MVEVIVGLLLGLILFAAATFCGGLIYLGAVWLNARRKRRGLWGRYSDWVARTATQIENKNKAQPPPHAAPGWKLVKDDEVHWHYERIGEDER